ncbi:hypothetical protein [Candidatus Pelagisphaera phototrophica]|uniref:hypothetical protein n=1 Tax=Candidatus Pelagisphaera phototrophica TaxID=2684113 RepID=UPI0019E07BE5|nr:hypothetical protein [Candidatus Pelagisphaera phototrophica]QXD31539.1 hypothetical protein GA004_14590 [Candidatus Pelagisphaera phototrophica]
MPRIAKLKPVKTEGGNWRFRIPTAHSNTGKRRRIFFPSEAKTEVEVRRIKSHINKLGSKRTRFMASESSDARTAINRLNSHHLSGEHELTLNAAASFYLDHLEKAEASKTFSEVFRISLRQRKNLYEEKNRKKWTTSHAGEWKAIILGPLPHAKASKEDRVAEQGFLHIFGGKLIDEITSEDVRAWMKKYHNTSDSAWNGAYRQVSPAFNNAQSRRLISTNPLSDPDRPIVKRSTKGTRDILAIKEFLFTNKAVQENRFSSIRAGVAIRLFAGLSPTEVKGNRDKRPLDWDSVTLEPKGVYRDPQIKVSGEQAKESSQRVVSVGPNLVQWLKSVPEDERGGPICWGKKNSSLLKKFSSEAKLKGWHDVLGHTYATYQYQYHANLHRTMKEMGHTSVKTFKDHYENPDFEADAPKKLSQSVPEGATVPEVVQFSNAS